MRPAPASMPDVSRRWVTRVSPDPYLRIDTNDYSLHPALVGRRVEVRVDQQHVLAAVLDSGEVACDHARVFAKHRRHPQEQTVQVRPLARYDARIA